MCKFKALNSSHNLLLPKKMVSVIDLDRKAMHKRYMSVFGRDRH